MPRTSRSRVRATFEDEFESQTGNPDHISPEAVDAHIKTATEMVDRIADAGAADEEALLRRIETLLAQHFLATQSPRYESQSGEVRSGQYEGETGEGLKSTRYGQDAIVLDPTGTLIESYGDSRDIIING